MEVLAFRSRALSFDTTPSPPLQLTPVKQKTVEFTYMSIRDLVERTRVALSP